MEEVDLWLFSEGRYRPGPGCELGGLDLSGSTQFTFTYRIVGTLRILGI
jgi:hypothetical protein